MNLLQYSVHNVGGVKDISFDMEGRHLYLVGGINGQGKTSALLALQMLLCGRSGMDNYPEIALREGQDEGWVRARLTGDDELHEPEGLTVELKLTRKRGGQVAEELRVLDSTGEEAPEPRTLLKRFIGLKAFDPEEFNRLDGKKQRDVLARLLGLDFSASRAEHKLLYEERTAANRSIKQSDAQAAKLTRHPDMPATPISTADLLAELEKRQATNKVNAASRKAAADGRSAVEANEAACKAKLQEISVLEKQLLVRKAELTDLDKQTFILLDKQADLECAAEEAVDVEEGSVRATIRDAAKINQQVAENEKYAAAQQWLAEERARVRQIEQRMQKLEEAEKAAMREAAFPVPGMSLDAEGVLYNGLPYEQANQALRAIVGARIGMALNPKLKLLVIYSGSAFDMNTLGELQKLAEDEGYQIIVEICTRTAADESLCAVVIRDGLVDGQELPAEHLLPSEGAEAFVASQKAAASERNRCELNHTDDFAG